MSTRDRTAHRVQTGPRAVPGRIADVMILAAEDKTVDGMTLEGGDTIAGVLTPVKVDTGYELPAAEQAVGGTIGFVGHVQRKLEEDTDYAGHSDAGHSDAVVADAVVLGVAVLDAAVLDAVRDVAVLGAAAQGTTGMTLRRQMPAAQGRHGVSLRLGCTSGPVLNSLRYLPSESIRSLNP